MGVWKVGPEFYETFLGSNLNKNKLVGNRKKGQKPEAESKDFCCRENLRVGLKVQTLNVES